jgi:hypothetical protein
MPVTSIFFQCEHSRFVDEIVLRSILKWPNVPSVYGWLRLDRRGDWLVRMPALPGAVPDNVPGTAQRFDRIRNPAVVEFIGRNYARDAEGRYYFQNGPQRVFVSLDCTPWVYRLDDLGSALIAHTGAAAGAPRAAFFDQHGALVLDCEHGIGVVLDRDLAALAERFADAAGRPLDAEEVFERVRSGAGLPARFMGAALTVAAVNSEELPARFGFVARPVPPPGEPDC